MPQIKTYPLHPTGARMPALGLGTWKVPKKDVKDIVKRAIQCGYRHIDCAAVYGNEQGVGKALKECTDEGLVTREDLWITSKLWNTKHHPDDVEAALQDTLTDLQLDYLDLYLIHWPVALKDGHGFPPKPEEMISLDDMPIASTWAAMEKCVDAGLTKHIGVSNFSIKKLQDLRKSARIPPSVNQVECHPY